MSLNSERCPKCFSLLGTWIDDPILTQNGSKFVYDESSGLLVPENDISKRNYKGFYRIKAEIIKELQDIRKLQEIDVGISEENRTEFSKVKSDEYGYWIINKNHIKELRESTEKILIAVGQSKEQYFNYDETETERQTPHQLDWIDLGLTTTSWKGQIKDQHIEDLRKFIQSYLSWKQLYWGGTGYTFPISANNYYIDLPESIGASWLNQWHFYAIDSNTPNQYYTRQIITDYGDIYLTRQTLDKILQLTNGAITSTLSSKGESLLPDPNCYGFSFPSGGGIYSYCNSLSDIRFSFKIRPETLFTVSTSTSLLSLTTHTLPDAYGGTVSWQDASHVIISLNCIPRQTGLGGSFTASYQNGAGQLGYGTNIVVSDSFSRSLYNDLLSKYPTMINYYNGVLSSEGVKINNIQISLNHYTNTSQGAHSIIMPVWEVSSSTSLTLNTLQITR